MARWTLVMLEHEIAATTLYVITNTTQLGHLWMSWAYSRPHVTPIYRTVRGKMIFCGNRYIWDTPTLVEQIEEGDTWTHTFYLQGLTPEANLWYYLHEAQPPSEWECQGPLTLVRLLAVGQPGSYLYFASRLKGMYRTTTFSGPGGPDPVWVPDNVGLGSLAIAQAVLDPFIPSHRRYVLAGGHLYRHFNTEDFGPANSVTILTWPEALALTGSPNGAILWIHPNRRHPGMLHVLWNSYPSADGAWHLRTLDYGEHWTAHRIYWHWITYSAGNIMAGFDKGTSEHPEGAVVYAAVNYQGSAKPYLGRSFDQGATWETVGGPDQARGDFRPRLWVDPSNQAVLYMGCHPGSPKTFRSEDHGDTWDRIDQGGNFCPTLEPGGHEAVLRSHYPNPLLLRVIRRFWIERSDDYGDSWDPTETTPVPLQTGRFTTDNPHLLYLAKTGSGSAPPPASKPHVLFVTDDEGATLYPKAGAHPELADGGGDSIPYNCGGATPDGILIVQ